MSISVTNTNGNSVSVTVNGQSTALVTTQQSSVTITASSQNSVTVTNKGPKGDTGAAGPQGPTGAGVAAGGTENQVLQKNSATDYDTKWSEYRLPGADGTANQFLKTDGSGTVSFSSVTQATGNELENVVEDTTPQLGGDLDVNGNKIVSAGGGDIRIEPTTTGDVIVRPVTGSISLQCQTGVEIDGKSFPASIKFLEADTQSPRHTISFFAPTTWDSNLTFTLPSADGSDGQVLKTNGSGVLSFVDKMDDVSDDTTPQLGGDLDVNGNKITSASNGDITIDPDGTGAIIFKSDDIQFDGAGTFQGKVKLYESDLLGSNFVALAAPLGVTSDTTFTLPDGPPLANNYALVSTTAGNMAWKEFLDGTSETLLGTTSLKAVGALDAMLAFYDDAGDNYVILRAPSVLTGNTTFVLPASDGSANQVLKTDGSGNLSFVDQSSGGTTLTQVFPMNFFDDLGTTRHYLPWKDINEQTTIYQEEAAMLMPYDGKIKSVSLKSSSISADGDITLRIHSIATGSNVFVGSAWTEEESETLSATSTDDHHTFHFVFDNAQHFEAGDSVTLSIQNSVDMTGNGYWYVSTIVEFDTSNGLGSSSTEHDVNP